MKPDTPHRFVQRVIDLAQVGAEFTDSGIDDYAIRTIQDNEPLKRAIGDRFAALIGSQPEVLPLVQAGTVQLRQHVEMELKADPALVRQAEKLNVSADQILKLLMLTWQIWQSLRTQPQ